MKAIIFGITIGIASLLSALAENRPAPGQPVITNITVDKEAVLLHVAIPAGFTNVILQTGPSLQGPWENNSEVKVADGANSLQFRFPRRGDLLFARILAQNAQGQVESLSLNYRGISPQLLTHENKNNATNSRSKLIATLRFKAIIDGLDTLQINGDGIFWSHLRYQVPHEVSFNGRSWSPADLNFIDLGADLSKHEISWQHTEIKVISARDIVALEKKPEGAIVHVYDIAWGASEYEFEVSIFSAPHRAPVKSTTARLRIRADIDGSDELVVNAREARWAHKQWQWPSNVQLNGVTWDPKATPTLAAPLPSGVDLSSARVVSTTGRGFANIEIRQQDILVSFADDFDGAEPYEVEIEFGN